MTADRPDLGEIHDRTPALAGRLGEQRAALVCADLRRFATLGRQLRRSVGSVDLQETLPDAREWARFGLVVVLYDELSADDRERLVGELPASPDGPTLLVLTRRLDRPNMAALLGARLLTNLLAIDDQGPDMADLLVTLQKLRRGDLFGLEKYFVWGVDPRVRVIRTSHERFGALDEVNAFAREMGISGRLRGAIRTVVEELLSNAIYNAPVGPDGRPRYASRPRTEAVELLESEEVVLRYCCDGRRFGVSVEDRFGSLEVRRVQDNLARAYRAGPDQVVQGSGGSGLGFYHVIDALSHFVVDIHPGRRTEMIGLLDVSSGYRRFAEFGRSFNIFVAGGAT